MDNIDKNQLEEFKNLKIQELKESTLKQVEELKEKNEPYLHLLMLCNESVRNIEQWYNQVKP